MIIHLIDGTYELFRHFYGIRRFKKTDPPFGAVAGVLNTVAKMIEDGATHVGVATDHVIESFRNDLWRDYKTSAGIEPVLRAQFHPLEEALAAMGVAVWPMIELEADDALSSAAHLTARGKRVEKNCILTPGKDLATLRTDAPLFKNVDELRWQGATPSFAAVIKKIGDARLATRVKKLGNVSTDCANYTD